MSARPTSFATIRSQFFSLSLRCAFVSQLLLSPRRSRRQNNRADYSLGWQECRASAQARAKMAALLSSFSATYNAPACSRKPRRTSRRHRSARTAPRPPANISSPVVTRTTSAPDGAESATGPEIRITSCFILERGRRDRVAHLPGGAVAQVTHRIERLARRPGGDDELHAIKFSWRASRNSARKAISSTFHKRPMPS